MSEANVPVLARADESCGVEGYVVSGNHSSNGDVDSEQRKDKAGRVRWLRDSVLALALAVLILLAAELIARFLTEPLPENEHERIETFEVPAKTQGTYRIVTIGASTVVGWPMPELGFAAQLEGLLRRMAPERPVEVINLGYLGKSSVYVRQMVEQAEAYKPDLLVIMSGHNEYLNRDDENRTVESRLSSAASRMALIRVLRNHLSIPRETPLSPNYFLPDRLIPYDHESRWFSERVTRHRENLAQAIGWAKAHEIPVLLCTLPSNVADWPPVHRLVAWASNIPNYDQDVAAIEAMIQTGDLPQAEQQIDSVQARYGEDAMMLYLKGQICRRGARMEEALALLTRAKDLDPFPYRALGAVNESIRQLADDGVYLVDLERIFGSNSAGNMPGWDLFADNVHPTSRGYALIATSLAEAMAQHSQFLKPDMQELLPKGPDESLQGFLDSIPSGGLKRWMMMKVAVAHSKYCQKYPFFFFERALFYQRDVIVRAQELQQDHWAFHGELGTLLILNGLEDEGLAELRLATKMKGAPLDPNDHGSVNWLPETLAKIGQTPESLATP